MAYRYCDQNLLEEPNTYMYPPYEGTRFLSEYFSSRLERMVCPDSNWDMPWFASFHAARAILWDWVNTKASINAQRIWTQYCISSAETLTAPEKVFCGSPPFRDCNDNLKILPLLSSLVAEQALGPIGKTTEVIWRKIVKRFEVSKRLYEFYSLDLKKGYGDYTDLRPYELLSLSSALHYSTTGSLVALNTQLKLNDVLCSLAITQRHSLSPGMLNMLLCSEIAFIDEMVYRKEIDLGS